MTGTEQGRSSRAALSLMELALGGKEITNPLLLAPSLGFRVNSTQHRQSKCCVHCGCTGPRRFWDILGWKCEG